METSMSCGNCKFGFDGPVLDCPNCGVAIVEDDAHVQMLREVWAAACVKAALATKEAADAVAVAEVAAANAAAADADVEAAFTASLNREPGSEASLDVAREIALEALSTATTAATAAALARHEAGYADHEAAEAAEAYAYAREDVEAASAAAHIDAAGNSLRREAAGGFEWKMRLLITAMVVAGFSTAGGFTYLILRKSPDEPAPAITRYKGEPLGLDESSAQVFCEQNIRKFANDPDTVKVPFVLNRGSGSTYEFNWNSETSLVRMRNGLGAEVAVRASCSVSTTTGKIISLTLDGQKVI